MAVGKSHRIVIEVEPAFKHQIYEALNRRGLTLKYWFTQKVLSDLVESKELEALECKEREGKR